MPDAFNDPGDGEIPSARYRPGVVTLDFYGKAIWTNEQEFFPNFIPWANDFFASNDGDPLVLEFHLERIKSHALNELREFLLKLAEMAHKSGKGIDLRWDWRGDISVENSINLLRGIVPDIRKSVGMEDGAFTLHFIPEPKLD